MCQIVIFFVFYFDGAMNCTLRQLNIHQPVGCILMHRHNTNIKKYDILNVHIPFEYGD